MDPEVVDQDAVRRAAVLARDAASDGLFVYAVRSTGVYCKPSCPSRPAKRENVRFFASGADASAAGFRPCRRCRPDEGGTQHTEAVRLACERIRSADETPDLKTLARDVDLSPGHFQRVFKAQVGLSPKQYALAERRKKLRGALATAATVTAAIYDAGYAASSRAYADADAVGLKPATLRCGGRGETIRFAVASSSLGDVVIATTARGLCFVEIGDPSHLKSELARRFPAAKLVAADRSFGEMVNRIVKMIDAPRANAALPLDVRVTSFQERVWRALTAIPLGETVSLIHAWEQYT